MNQVLIVDDNEGILSLLSEFLTYHKLKVTTSSSIEDALALFKRGNFAAILLDLLFPHANGLQAIKKFKKIQSNIPIIIITGSGDIPTAVESMKLGVSDFISKPLDLDKLLTVIRSCVHTLQKKTGCDNDISLNLGSSSAIQKLVKNIALVAKSNFSIVLQGETGTGKSYLANLIHKLNPERANNAFVKVDIGAIPETLVESELFGYQKGSFTGAVRNRDGYFVMANGGTLFIDEIENMSTYVQAKLLSVVEERKVSPLGMADKPSEIDIRLITACNVNLETLVKQKKFREDLFFRLGEFIFSIPSLRTRVDDISFFANQFLKEENKKSQKQITAFSEPAMNKLLTYSWPGNIRELKTVIKKATFFCESNIVQVDNIDLSSYQFMTQEIDPEYSLKSQVIDVERRAIETALTVTAWNKTKAAHLLEIDYKTLLTKMKKYSLPS